MPRSRRGRRGGDDATETDRDPCDALAIIGAINEGVWPRATACSGYGGEPAAKRRSNPIKTCRSVGGPEIRGATPSALCRRSRQERFNNRESFFARDSPALEQHLRQVFDSASLPSYKPTSLGL